MTENPLTLAEIVSWYRSKQLSLANSGISLVDIRETNTGRKPAAVADFDGVDVTGRITGWVSGEFDFEAVRGSDGKSIFCRHVDVLAVQGLESAYADFIGNMLNPGRGVG